MRIPGTVILSRPDALGDAVVTLTTAGWIKAHAPDTRIIVICKEYARAVWKHCDHVDAIITLEELQAGDAPSMLAATKADAIVHVFPHRDVALWAKKAGIPLRIATSHRLFNWTTCNKLVHFTRKRSLLHEAQLNIKLLEPFGLPMPTNVQELVPHMGLRAPTPTDEVRSLLRMDRKRVILHPLLGSGVGWGLDNYATLMRSLDPTKWQVIITGTSKEAGIYRKELPMDLPHVADAGGRYDLEELMMLIGSCNAMVAASTGPLHIAAALGLRTVGLFSMRRPIFPARWAPLGIDAHALTFDPQCATCAAGKECDCITRIPVQRVMDLLERD
ncbi:MAG: glycosyltransferase family 9 protein [Flavobacteriales bacterium]|nr:glycosyltransferase family 9 protein [Flavobacteriales bacterium]